MGVKRCCFGKVEESLTLRMCSHAEMSHSTAWCNHRNLIVEVLHVNGGTQLLSKLHASLLGRAHHFPLNLYPYPNHNHQQQPMPTHIHPCPPTTWAWVWAPNVGLCYLDSRATNWRGGGCWCECVAMIPVG